MTFIQNLFNSIPPAWAVLALVMLIGLSVVFLRGLIRLAIRALFIGLIGLLIIGVFYFFF